MRRADERGSALVMASFVALVLAVIVGVIVAAGVVNAAGQRVQGATDLAALAGARAQAENADACLAAERSAALAAVEVVGCRVTGDDVEFVVTVEARTEVSVGPWRHRLEARSHAGLVTGAPE